MFRPFGTRLLNFWRPGEQSERRCFDTDLRFGDRIEVPVHGNLYEQRDFQHLLYIEKRRSERSNHPLCLVLVAGIRIKDEAVRTRAFRNLFHLLRSSIRETDIVGWYRHNCILGIVFPDLNPVAPTVIDGLRSKVTDAIATLLSSELAGSIDVSVYMYPGNHDTAGEIDTSIFYPDAPPQHQGGGPGQAVKRLIDIAGSLLLLTALAPLFAVIAAAIKVNSKGPVIFHQVRIGQRGIPFSFVKFRSMYMDSDVALHKEYVTKFISSDQPASATSPVYKITNDPRVTRVGRFLRKTSLDELPQLWNVLRGEMSLVGPRPPLPYELKCYAPWHRRRVLWVKPGITGLWQVTGRSRTTFNEMVRLDLRYVRQWSIWLDFKILLQTPKAVLMGEGAY
jgi:lipopolysaccharide/colanic/teichoic acid biosynthesis glycosyltransferase